MTIKFTGCHFPSEIILQSVRYYLSYKLSYREIEEILAERGVIIDHSTLNRWVLKYAPLLEQRARRRKKPVACSWRMDETYINVKGQWKYYYRAVDKYGDCERYRANYIVASRGTALYHLRYLSLFETPELEHKV